MKIDTRYIDGSEVVTMELQTEDERALGDDLLARIGCNQHRLSWLRGHEGRVDVVQDPSSFRIPLSYRNWSCERLEPGPGGRVIASLTYRVTED